MSAAGNRLHRRFPPESGASPHDAARAHHPSPREPTVSMFLDGQRFAIRGHRGPDSLAHIKAAVRELRRMAFASVDVHRSLRIRRRGELPLAF